MTNFDKKTFQEINLDATDSTAQIKDVHQNSNIQFSLSASGSDGTITGGTVTILVRSPGALVFETPVPPIAIDLSAPETFSINGKAVGDIECTIAAFTGTATKFNLAASDYV